MEWQCDLVVDSTIDKKNPLESLDQEEEYRDQLLVTNREYRELQMALDDCNSHIPQVLFFHLSRPIEFRSQLFRA